MVIRCIEIISKTCLQLPAWVFFLGAAMLLVGCAEFDSSLSDEDICELAKNPGLKASLADDQSLIDSLVDRFHSPPEGEAGKCLVYVIKACAPPPNSTIKESLAQVDLSVQSSGQAKTLSFLQIAYSEPRDAELLRRFLASKDLEVVLACLYRVNEMADKPVALLPDIVGLLESSDIGLLQSAVATVAFYDGHAVVYIDAVKEALGRMEDYAISRPAESQKEKWLKTLANYRVSYLDRLIAFRDGVPPLQDRQFLPGGEAYDAGYRRPAVEEGWK